MEHLEYILQTQHAFLRMNSWASYHKNVVIDIIQYFIQWDFASKSHEDNVYVQNFYIYEDIYGV